MNQHSSKDREFPVSAKMNPEVVNIPVPIMLAKTRIVAVNSPMSLFRMFRFRSPFFTTYFRREFKRSHFLEETDKIAKAF